MTTIGLDTTALHRASSSNPTLVASSQIQIPPFSRTHAPTAVSTTSEGPPAPKRRKLQIPSSVHYHGPGWRPSRARSKSVAGKYMRNSYTYPTKKPGLPSLTAENEACFRLTLLPDRPVKDCRPRKHLQSENKHRCRIFSKSCEWSSRSQHEYSDVSNLYPWAGHHAEDHLNETSTRNGYFLKVQANINEFNSARAVLWSRLKRKEGLPNLTMICTSAMRRRMQSGRVYGENSFKLPPRVTLTDTKRESWLAGLCNPMVSLRSLSRSIPHGIRGKVLLEQCLNKRVPLSRAIWLVKCVGANEIRAFKRKGPGSVMNVGGETKWLRDWTSNVQQFLLGIIESQDFHDWRHHYAYGLSFTSRLSREQLLDDAQFLDWVLESLGDSSSNMLMSWLVLLSVHWRTITQQSSLSRLLIASLSEQAKNIAKYDTASSSEIHKLLGRTVLAVSQSCVAPGRRLCSGSLPTDDVKSSLRLLFMPFTALFEHLDLQQPYRHNDAEAPLQLALSQHLLTLFNEFSPYSDHEQEALNCLRLTNDDLMIIRLCLSWSACRRRPANYRPLAASILMRLWAQKGVDLQNNLHKVLSVAASQQHHDIGDIFRVITELVSSGDFQINRYCHWLLATGLLRNNKLAIQPANFHVALLQYLSLRSNLPFELPLCHSLIAATGDPGAVAALRRVKLLLLDYIHGPTADAAPTTNASLDLEITTLDQQTKIIASDWLHQALFTPMSAVEPSLRISRDGDGSDNVPQYRCLPPTKLVAALDLFALMDDFRLYADSFQYFASSAESFLLLLLCDSMNTHIRSLMWNRIDRKLFASLHERLRDMNGLQIFDKALLESFSDLAHHVTGYQDLRESLRERLSIVTREAPLRDDTTDPENLTVIVDDHENDALQGLVSLVSRSTTLDEQLCNRVGDMMKGWLTNPTSDPGLWAQLSYISTRLQSLNPLSFKALCSGLVRTVLTATDGQSAAEGLTLLICSGATSLNAMMADARDILENEKVHELRSGVAIKMLDFLGGAGVHAARVSRLRAYRFLDQRTQLFHSCRSSILYLFSLTDFAEPIFEEPRATFSGSQCKLYLFMLNELLCGLNPADTDSLFITSKQWIELGRCSINLAACIDRHGGIRQIEEVFSAVDESTLVLSRMQLLALHDRWGSPHGTKDGLAKQLMDIIDATQPVRLSLWAYLMREILPERPQASFSGPAGRSSGDSATIARDSAGSTLPQTDLWPVVTFSASLLAENARSKLVDLERLAITRSSLSWLQQEPTLKAKWPVSGLLSVVVHSLIATGIKSMDDISQGENSGSRALNDLRMTICKTESMMSAYCSKAFFASLATLLAYYSSDAIHPANRASVLALRQSRSYGDGIVYLDQFAEVSPLTQTTLRYNGTAGSSTKGGHTILEPKRSHPIIRRWEMIPDAAPVQAHNDTCLNIVSFGAEEALIL